MSVIRYSSYPDRTLLDTSRTCPITLPWRTSSYPGHTIA